eukprot:6200548-Pleurochrysis_carterae.AAC.1
MPPSPHCPFPNSRGFPTTASWRTPFNSSLTSLTDPAQPSTHLAATALKTLSGVHITLSFSPPRLLASSQHELAS